MTKILLTFFLTTVILNTIVAEIKKYKPVHNCPKIPSNGQKYVSPINTNTKEKLDLHYQDCALCPADVKECYIRPLFTPQETGLEKSNYGNFEQYLNKPIKNGIFYFHAYKDSDKHTYGGECGLGVRYAMHAAVGRAFYSSANKWIRSK
ncbi:Effector protein GPP [Meloidogyne graminicola]|uniref:Effector protein GPP n=1 Tax=Meloidogyne graminicola TaxID=189291 RepID=A0A8S9ZR29_9BILA|nr:Effector protein GPP [Meloidogyne graminicola]